MSFIYQFSIRKGATSEPAVEVHPVWKDDLSIEMAKESQQQFFRRKLSGSIDLIRDDYDLIMNEPFGTVFFLEIWTSVDGGSTYSFYWRGRFTLTDCKVNTDDKILTVKPEVYDEYTDILAGLEREFDLIQLAPVIDRVKLIKRPCIQIFNRASETVTSVCGNLSFEQDVSLPSDDIAQFLVDHCHFFPISSPVSITIPDPPLGYESAFASPFTGTLDPNGATLTNTEDTFYMEYWVEPWIVPGSVGYIHGIDVISRSQGDTRWKWQEFVPYPNSPLPTNITFETQTSQTVNMDAVTTDMGLYSRVVCNVEEYAGEDTFELPSDDVVTYNRNYKRAFPYDASSMIVSSSRVQNDPAQWGKRESDGKYYLPPQGQTGDEYIPIGKNLWGIESVWLLKTNDYQDIEQDATQELYLNDAYPLWSCISVLLNEIAPDVTFDGTTDYSDFLYSGHDEIAVRDNCLYLTPKSNITNGEYQTPAQKAPVTLKDILSMLKNVYQCYWFVERKMVGGVMKTCLRIEHIRYFLYGGSYSSLHPSVGTDLTTMINRRNGKAWSFAVNSYEFDKIDMPERYQFAWMDEVTDPFKGKPIVVLSSYVEQGKVEEINVANFTSDIDFMMLNPSSISPDGFALLNVLTDQNDGTLYVPVITFTLVGYSWRAQNGYLSYHMLQFGYWKDNMPAWHLQFEDDPNITAETIQRNKKQTVTIPLAITDPDPMQLVKTGMGNGQVQSMSIRLTSRIAKTILKYDTE